jgi:beta-phosphoglucomutase-like phosphatase (HAD superfamily)
MTQTSPMTEAGRRHPFELDTVAWHWQLALDAGHRALRAAEHELPGSELARRRRDLVLERDQTAKALARLAQVTGVRPAPWLSPVPLDAKMLGLPTTVRACVFDLEGVLTDSGALHAWAWAVVFDEFLQRFSERNSWHFIPFDSDGDYHAYIEGRPRLEGIHAFLDSRGIRLPEGRPDDGEAETAYGLARRKSDALAGGLRQRGVTAVAGARRYLEAAGDVGLKRAVVSASTSTLPMLELAGLATLVEERVDADLIRLENLRSRPAPDLLLAACRRLGVDTDEAVTFTPIPAGVAAGHAAGLGVIGVGDDSQAEVLRGFGAERVVPSLTALLDRQLVDTT